MLDLTKYQPQWVKISYINVANRMFQFRKDVTQESVSELAKSMADEGQKMPIILWRRNDGELVDVAGLRRLTAAISLKWESIFAIKIPETEANLEDMLRLNFIENIERKTLNNLDIMYLCKKLKDQGKTNEEIGGYIKKSENQVRRYIKVAEAPAGQQQKLAAGDTSIRGISGEQIASRGDASENNKKYLVKSTKNGIEAKIKIEAFPENEAALGAFIAEIKKAWRQALKSKTRLTGGKAAKKSKQASSSDPALPMPAGLSDACPLMGKEEAGKAGAAASEGVPGEPTTGASGISDAELQEMQAQRQKSLDALKNSLNTPEGRAMVEPFAKAQGFNSPEEYVAHIEETIKKQRLG
jgi:ParB/RepB/Spo0J family partition protein